MRVWPLSWLRSQPQSMLVPWYRFLQIQTLLSFWLQHLLTQKTSVVPPPPGEFDERDLFIRQWRQVQSLHSGIERVRVRVGKEYLATLQNRRKWQNESSNLQVGDVVLLKNIQAKRNDWPMRIVLETFPRRHGKVRKVQVKVVKEESSKVFLQLISDIVLLLSPGTE